MRELEQLVGEITPRVAANLLLGIDSYAEQYQSLTGRIMTVEEKRAVCRLLRVALKRECCA